jgi:hypothetical protein
MHLNFREFLKQGGNGQYVISRDHGTIKGHRAAISIKSLFFPATPTCGPTSRIS